MKAKLRNSEFEYILYSVDNEDNFSKIKRFCGNQVTISYETCEIDDYWLVELTDFCDNKVVVCAGDYIVKIGYKEFVKLSEREFNDYFDNKKSSEI